MNATAELLLLLAGLSALFVCLGLLSMVYEQVGDWLSRRPRTTNASGPTPLTRQQQPRRRPRRPLRNARRRASPPTGDALGG